MKRSLHRFAGLASIALLVACSGGTAISGKSGKDAAAQDGLAGESGPPDAGTPDGLASESGLPDAGAPDGASSDGDAMSGPACAPLSKWKSFAPTPAPSRPPPTWQPISTQGAPSPREKPSEVWTGSEMIVWGGIDDNAGDPAAGGGRYRPSDDTWLPMSGTGEPAPRSRHAAVWTGTEMIVWGGTSGATDGGPPAYLADGGRYDPATDSWTPMATAGAPACADMPERAFWTGTEMLVYCFSSGNVGLYDPSTDTWRAASALGHAWGRPVWTGKVLLANGQVDGCNGIVSYDPGLDTWTVVGSGALYPAQIYDFAQVWTGTSVFHSGGQDDNDYSYDLASTYDPDTNTGTNGMPAGFSGLARNAWWVPDPSPGGSGRVMAQVLAGIGSYDLASGQMSTFTLPADCPYTVPVWTGQELLFWSNLQGRPGCRYRP